MTILQFDTDFQHIGIAQGQFLHVFNNKEKTHFTLECETKDTAQPVGKKSSKKKKAHTVDLRQLIEVPSVIRTYQFSGDYIITGSDDKMVRVWQISTKSLLASTTISKKLEQSCITPDGHLLIADRPGDVFQYSLPSLSDMKCVMGHFGLLTGLDMAGKDSVISCDIDAKIRISSYPLMADIKRFCLGHDTFVSCMVCVPEAEKCPQRLLVTAGGNNELKVWQYEEGTCVLTLPIKVEGIELDSEAHKPNMSNSEVETIMRSQYIKNKAQGKQDDPLDEKVSLPDLVKGFEPFINVLSYDAGSGALAVVLYPYCCVLTYKLNVTDSGVELVHTSSIKTATAPVSVKFGDGGALFVVQRCAKAPLLVLNASGDAVEGHEWMNEKLAEHVALTSSSTCEDHERRRFSRHHREQEYKAVAERNRARVSEHNAQKAAERAAKKQKTEDNTTEGDGEGGEE